MENTVVTKRLKKKIDSAKEKILNIKNRDLEEDDIKRLFIDILSDLLGFNKESEIIDLKTNKKSCCYLGIQIDGEIKFIMQCSAPKFNLKNRLIEKTFEIGSKYHAEWLVKTNAIKWEIYQSKCDEPNEYDLSCQFNFIDLNLKNKVDLAHILLICKEAHVKSPTTDQFNRLQWFCFLSEDEKTIEFMFLVNQCLYEDGSGKFHIPFLNVTYRCNESQSARQNAWKAIEKFLQKDRDRAYDHIHKFTTVAYHKEAEKVKMNQPVWW